MWIQVRTIDGSQTRTIEDVSRKATIEELRERVWALFDVRPECQRLFYRGKQVRRPAGSPGASSRRPGTRLRCPGLRPAVLGMGRWRGAGCGAQSPGLQLWGPHLQARLAGRKARVRGAVCSGAAATGIGSGRPGGPSSCLWGDRSLEKATGSGSHAGAPEGRAGFIRSAVSAPRRTCLSSVPPGS